MTAALEPIRDGVVRIERAGAVTVLTLNRPEARNAVNIELATALGEALEWAKADETTRALVLRGEGKSFCAGQDLKALDAGEAVGLPEHPDWGFGGIVRHIVDKPIVAAVHGFAFGGGLELALSCDLVVLSETASIGLPEVTLGLFAAAGGVPRVAQHLPPKVAAQLALTGAPMPAAEALRWGVVNETAPEAEVFDRALALAERIAANAPLAVQATKRILRDLGTASTWTNDTWNVIQSELDSVFSSADAAEGVRAFVEKRPARWSGR